ncbi:hypothetical protein K6U06_18765 [Acidiferrimicrobium sp. IK]|uniref:hypothetical protein n=1 Tax=Acidiferrimicrobium sp. IK TaxID=2871700 RepID=UPI0021CB2BAF|nr:hypothetical protein [Acidiferrimicrobium sp. IK]MCU4186417.1 hypothetical protein [Acidiferrimicrobium sp. IK]
MSTPLFLASRALLGGLLVVVFALIGEVVKPKRFAGLFGAAPSVALANLALVVAVEGTAKAAVESRAMIAGALALVVACSVGVVAVRRWHALKGTGVMATAWLAVAAVARVVAY